EPERVLMTEVLNGRGTKHMEVIPNGVDPGLLHYVGPPKEKDVLVFSGAMTYNPNLDAARQLCGDVLPRIRKSVPQTSLRITGGCGDLDVTDMQSISGVEFTGYVDDIRPVVASASALVVPLRIGGGTRLKILESMALGTPVVSTPIGAEGLDVTDGVDILLGESPEELAAQTVRLLTDPDLASRVSSAAAQLVGERYRWPDIAEKFERTVSTCVTSELERSNVRSG
ncbi:MAG TPA: glycosyltransferase family 4 protein, partial [Armatimonadota bacterium]